jgi:hypothetical protein
MIGCGFFLTVSLRDEFDGVDGVDGVDSCNGGVDRDYAAILSVILSTVLSLVCE